MTGETRYIFDLKDVAALRFQCVSPGCGAETVRHLPKDVFMPSACPVCGAEWLELGVGPIGVNNRLVMAVQEILRRDDLPMNVRSRYYAGADGLAGRRCSPTRRGQNGGKEKI